MPSANVELWREPCGGSPRVYELNFVNVRAVRMSMLRRILTAVWGSPFGSLLGVVVGKNLGNPLLGVVIGMTVFALLMWAALTYLQVPYDKRNR